MSRTRLGESPPIDAADIDALSMSHCDTPADDDHRSMAVVSTAAHEVNGMTNVTGAAMEIDSVRDATLKEVCASTSSCVPSGPSACDCASVTVNVSAAAASSAGMQKAIAGEPNLNGDQHDGDGEDDESDDPPHSHVAAHHDGESGRRVTKRRKRSHPTSHHRPHRADDPNATTHPVVHPVAASSSSSSSFQPAAAAAASTSPIDSVGDSPLTASVSESRTHSQSVTESGQPKGSHQHEKQQTRKGKRKRTGGSKKQKERGQRDTHTDAIRAKGDIAKSAPPASSSSASSTMADLPIARRPILNGGRRISPRRTCYFSMLATDEVRSVMQMLDRVSLFRLARCSKRMMSDADSDVAWRYSNPFELDVGLSGVDVAHLSGLCNDIRSSPLLSHIPIGIRLYSLNDIRGRNDSHLFVPDGAIQLLIDIPHITKLRMECILNEDQWRRLLTSRASRDLTQLTVNADTFYSEHPWPLPSVFMNHLVRLTRLTHLDIRDPAMTGNDFSLLSQLPSLSSLTFHDKPALATGSRIGFNPNTATSFAPAIAHCRSINKLKILYLNAYGNQFSDLFTSPHIGATLKELTIDGYFVAGFTPGAVYRASFKALTRLETLTLTLTSGEVLLPYVPHLASLVELRLIHLVDSWRSGPALRRMLRIPSDGSEADANHPDQHHANQPEAEPIDSSHAIASESESDRSDPDDESLLNHRFSVYMLIEPDEWMIGSYHTFFNYYHSFFTIEEETPRFTMEVDQPLDWGW